jgi:hypothetical protein
MGIKDFPILCRQLTISYIQHDPFHVYTVVKMASALGFNYDAIKGLFPLYTISILVYQIVTDGFQLAEVFQETNTMFSVYVFMACCKCFQFFAHSA